jgi:hypothetical protein
MPQHGLTIIAPILPGKTKSLRELLNFIGTNIDGNGLIDFYKLTKVHFMRWVILPSQSLHGKIVPDQLVLSTNFDGKEREHLMELAQVGSKGLDQIYSFCEGYVSGSDPQSIAAFLKSKINPNSAFYVGTTGRSVEQIHQERSLRYAIQAYLQASNPSQNWSGRSPIDLRREIAGEILAKPHFAWAKKKYVPPFLFRFGRLLLGIAGLVLVSLFVLGFIFQCQVTSVVLLALVVFVMVWYQVLRDKEKKDTADFVPSPRDAERLADLHTREDFRIQNQITHLVEIKPGWFRLRTLKFVLGAINLLARLLYNRGNLAGIPSIHFARWAIIDNGRRLLFFSNFDGSWESYLGEFIDRAAIGLTGVWSNAEGFPPTRSLIKEGARRSADFKAWVRAKQIETQVWYSAYKTLTVENINNSTDIRNGISGELDSEQSAAWLQKLN